MGEAFLSQPSRPSVPYGRILGFLNTLVAKTSLIYKLFYSPSLLAVRWVKRDKKGNVGVRVPGAWCWDMG